MVNLFELVMGKVYLIGEMDNANRYKIGVSNQKKAEKRMKGLQTGNSDELYIRYTFETDKPFKLENFLHRHYSKNHILNEWFDLDEKEAKEFPNICQKYQSIIDSLKDNPFYK